MEHRLIPLEDFFRNSERTSFQLSPDGRHLAYLAPYENRMNVYVRPLGGDTDQPLRVTEETARDVAGYCWADNERLLFMKDVGGDENYQLFGVRCDGSDLRAYTPFPGVRTALLDDLEEQPDVVMIEMNRRNPEVFDPYRLNLRTGELTLLAENPGNYQGWMTDHQGRLRAATAIVDGVNTQLLYRDTEDEPFRVVLTTNFKTTVNFLLFTPDDKQVYAVSNRDRDKLALVLMDPASATELEVLYEDERYDVSSIMYSRKRKKLLSVYCTGHKEPVRHYFDEEERALRERIKRHFPHHRVAVADTDKAEENYLLYAGGDRTRGAY